MNQENSDAPLGSATWQGIFGIVRTLLFLLIPCFIAGFVSVNFHGVIPGEVAAQYRETSPWVFFFWPDFLLKAFAAVANPYGLRYLIAPYLAAILGLIGAAYYVMDVYNLDFSTAFLYILASMFTIRYPKLVIDKGEIQSKPNETNPIISIGGPGHVLIEPGSAAMFRHLRHPGQTMLTTTYFLAPFEQIAFPVDLDEHQSDKDEIRAITQDGIQVKLCDVHIRYRIQQKRHNGFPIRRTVDNPFPLEQDAIRRMMGNLSVDKDGLDKWTIAVDRYVIGEIMDFIAAHPIDYLTAPRSDRFNARLELKSELFFRRMREYLA
ncbi:MAG: hypothetical protein IH586_18645, partial [Anaerolineaceae bacterium]|nr:hypothetical protein [Anaerolineaceae bacterium]